MLNINDKTTLGELLHAGINVKLDLMGEYKHLCEAMAPKAEEVPTYPTDTIPAPPAPAPTTEDLKQALNNVALKVSPAKARAILGEGNTLADVADIAAMIQTCNEAIQAKRQQDGL